MLHLILSMLLNVNNIRTSIKTDFDNKKQNVQIVTIQITYIFLSHRMTILKNQLLTILSMCCILNEITSHPI